VDELTRTEQEAMIIKIHMTTHKHYNMYIEQLQPYPQVKETNRYLCCFKEPPNTGQNLNVLSQQKDVMGFLLNPETGISTKNLNERR
jgi:hypothetical protein